ncbi:somatostatin receptor type 2-like [Asterias amurensis]|uniref:somatostatin receptor type 2-like n=1 Tax=Asterias amurensis TaxID=7602 RepID=UPI003AB8999C
MEGNLHSDLSTQVSSAKMYSLTTQHPIYQGEDTTDYWDNSSSDANSNATENIQSVLFQRFLAPLIFGCISIVGIVGNGLVIIVLLKYANMRTIPNVYILSLALMDFMFVLSLPMVGYQFSTNNWPFGYFMCKLVPGIDGFNQFGSVNIMTMMSADRYVAVVYPLSSMRYRTKKTARIVCGVVFLISFILCTPSWYFMELKVTGYGLTYCIAIPPSWDKEGIYYTLYYACLGFLIPLAIIIVCYSTLLFKILGSKLRIRSDGTGTAQRASKRVSILTVSVIVVFVVCWLPYNVVQLFHQFTTGEVSHAFRIAYTVSSLWCYTNSCFNPIVYTFIGENFKKNVMHLCPFCTSPDDTKLDRYRSNRESSTYIRGGTLRLHSVQHEAPASPPAMATNPTAITDVTSFTEAPANTQTYTFSNNNTHNSCGKE